MSELRTILTLAFSLLASLPSAIAQSSSVETSQDVDALIVNLESRQWEQAVEELAAIGAPAVAPLIAATRGGGAWSAPRACVALGRIGTPDAVAALIEASRQPVVRMRQYAAIALRHIPPDLATPLLCEALREDAAWQVRMSAAQSLGTVGGEAAERALVAALLDGVEYVRGDAAASLDGWRTWERCRMTRNTWRCRRASCGAASCA